MNEASQDEAALHALGLLDAEERLRFEAELTRDAGLRDYGRGLDEAVAGLAAAMPPVPPPERLRARVLGEIFLAADNAPGKPQTGKIVVFPRLAWGIAAALLLCCTLLGVDRFRLERRMEALRRSDNLSRLRLYALLNVPGGPAAARATVVYDPQRQEGLLDVEQLPPHPPGKDYQLWALEVGEKDTTKAISNGVVHLDPNGTAQVRFRPGRSPGRALSIFAIALEEEGGAPVHIGPVVMKARPRGD